MTDVRELLVNLSETESIDSVRQKFDIYMCANCGTMMTIEIEKPFTNPEPFQCINCHTLELEHFDTILVCSKCRRVSVDMGESVCVHCKG